MLTIDQVLDGYHLIRPIGRGGFGEVWLCRSVSLGDFRALKWISTIDSTSLDKEFAALSHCRKATNSLRSPDLISIEHANRTSKGLFYVMPLADGLNGCDFLDKEWEPSTLAAKIEARRTQPQWFSSDQVIEWIEPLLRGLQVLSDAGLVHRDVKPDNILFFDGRPCLGDISLVCEDSQTITQRGTPGYSAPSWYLESGGHPDMYGVACVLFALLTGNSPDKIGRPRFRWPPQGESSLSPEERERWLKFHRVILRLLDEEPNERFLNFTSVSQALLHRSEVRATAFVAETSQSKSADPLRGQKSTIAGFVLGLLGLYAWFLPFLGFPITITGLVFSLMGLKSPFRKLTTASIILNIVFLICTIVNSAIGLIGGLMGIFRF
jgi:serine/threonine protein kinase